MYIIVYVNNVFIETVVLPDVVGMDVLGCASIPTIEAAIEANCKRGNCPAIRNN